MRKKKKINFTYYKKKQRKYNNSQKIKKKKNKKTKINKTNINRNSRWFSMWKINIIKRNKKSNNRI